MPEPSATYKNVREAWTAVRKKPRETFEKRLMRQCMPLHARLFAPLARMGDKRHFQKDLEGLRAIGNSTNVDEFNHAVGSLSNMTLVERSLLRRFLGIRVDAERVAAELDDLVSMLKPVAPPPDLYTSPKASAGRGGGTAGSAGPVREANPSAIRRLRVVHEAVVKGMAPEKAAEAEGWDFAAMTSLLAEYKQGRPDLEWLASYLGQLEQIRSLEAENQRLTRLTTELSSRLVQSG
jgi:hypothetical protein